jgi:transcriptional regulator with XRE-family HTH domain
MSAYKFGRTIPEFIRRYRQDMGLSQADLARTLRYKSGQYISNVERGLKINPQGLCVKLSRQLDKSRSAWLAELLIENRAQMIGEKFKRSK